MEKMKAFVKTTNGNFPNQNFYLAWKGFTQIGYDVTKFEESDLNNQSFWDSCSKETPVFAGVGVFDDVVKKLGVTYNKIDTYPETLWPYMNRTIYTDILMQFEVDWNITQKPIFIKPIDQKVFNGLVVRNSIDWIPLINTPKTTKIYVVDLIEFISEYRIYIHNNEIVTGKHYRGDWSKAIDINVVEEAIRKFSSIAPVAYALDFGLTSDGKTALVEFNDFTSLGNYGLDSIHYSEMIADRWFEITKT